MNCKLFFTHTIWLPAFLFLGNPVPTTYVDSRDQGQSRFPDRIAPERRSRLTSAIAFILIVVATASSGAIFKPGPWYETLRKPAWTPPKWAFPVVWTILYMMIAYAGWIVWQQAGWSVALLAWGVQILANAAWSWLFFGRRRMDLALADIGVLWLSIVAFIVLAWPISTLAALLFLPYLAWVSTAGALNYSVLRLNSAG
jgi:translocator protein